MLIAGDDERTLFELLYNEEHELVDISFNHLRIIDIPSLEVARLEALSSDKNRNDWGNLVSAARLEEINNVHAVAE